MYRASYDNVLIPTRCAVITINFYFYSTVFALHVPNQSTRSKHVEQKLRNKNKNKN